MAKQIPSDVVIKTREMHTAGEPLRVVESGFPSPRGDTILDKSPLHPGTSRPLQKTANERASRPS
ncbi:hypothetical protein KP79_PYT26301 [Mizuhopecten yessoensis]|uniref:Uncharacterized protein n=1 Tax=Mizuhopecten yessoensis TaxID=6573 RepID=A0A210Q9M3_MIZYE|nr:hypothetical protein KP79_PYT26301 [Mizuhopecten yessoensis]